MKILFKGERNSGKSSRIYEILKNKNCGGIVCLPVFENGIKIGSDAVDMMSGRRVIFTRRKEIADFEGIDTENYRISNDGINFCIIAIEKSIGSCKWTIIDEFGRLEKEKKGLYDVIRKGIEEDKNMIIILRGSMERIFLKMFPYKFESIDIKDCWKIEDYIKTD